MKLLVPLSALALRAVILKTSVPDLHIVKIEPGANVHSMARHDIYHCLATKMVPQQHAFSADFACCFLAATASSKANVLPKNMAQQDM